MMGAMLFLFGMGRLWAVLLWFKVWFYWSSSVPRTWGLLQMWPCLFIFGPIYVGVYVKKKNTESRACSWLIAWAVLLARPLLCTLFFEVVGRHRLCHAEKPLGRIQFHSVRSHQHVCLKCVLFLSMYRIIVTCTEIEWRNFILHTI